MLESIIRFASATYYILLTAFSPIFDIVASGVSFVAAKIASVFTAPFRYIDPNLNSMGSKMGGFFPKMLNLSKTMLGVIQSKALEFYTMAIVPAMQFLSPIFEPFARINASVVRGIQALITRFPWIDKFFTPLAILTPLIYVLEALIAILAIPYIAALVVSTFAFIYSFAVTWFRSFIDVAKCYFFSKSARYAQVRQAFTNFKHEIKALFTNAARESLALRIKSFIGSFVKFIISVPVNFISRIVKVTFDGTLYVIAKPFSVAFHHAKTAFNDTLEFPLFKMILAPWVMQHDLDEEAYDENSADARSQASVPIFVGPDMGDPGEFATQIVQRDITELQTDLKEQRDMLLKYGSSLKELTGAMGTLKGIVQTQEELHRTREAIRSANEQSVAAGTSVLPTDQSSLLGNTQPSRTAVSAPNLGVGDRSSQGSAPKVFST